MSSFFLDELSLFLLDELFLTPWVLLAAPNYLVMSTYLWALTNTAEEGGEKSKDGAATLLFPSL